ncbi:MAG TPA: phosphatase PAP2 family protein [Euzebya sp.]|nr:phosphatase PAP2 family protein [Euzebya sp.]
MQRRVRRLAPVPVRKADLAVFRAVARTEVPVLGRWLPRLSTAANNSRLWMAIALALGAVGGRAGQRAGMRGMVAVGVTSALTNLPAKYLAGRGRPDIALVPVVRHLARLPASTSFPSGHSASAFAFAEGVGLELSQLRPVLYPVAGAVAFSRVYTGVHYPGDVIVGSAIGVAVARATTRWWPLPRTPVRSPRSPAARSR